MLPRAAAKTKQGVKPFQPIESFNEGGSKDLLTDLRVRD